MIATPHLGRFIVIEGPNGAGKTSFQEGLVRELLCRGYGVRSVREPGGTELGAKVRPLLMGLEMTDFARALLFNALRVEHCKKVIEPALDAGEMVICDRFTDSTRVYQIALGDMSAGERDVVNSIHANIIEPDLRVLLLPSIELIRKRLVGRSGERDVFEGNLEAEYAAYEEVANRPASRNSTIVLRFAEDTQNDLVSMLFEHTSFKQVVPPTYHPALSCALRRH